MKEIIKLETLELQLAKEFLTNENNIKDIQKQIDELKNNVYDFSTMDGVNEAKELKTKANKFVKELKEFCEPLEADGKKIANARSAITTKLTTGKDAVIDQILAPVYEREDKIKLIKSKLFIPSLNAGANAEKLAEVEAFNSYDWLAFKADAELILSQHKAFLLNEKIRFDNEAKIALEIENRARQEKENQMRLEAEARANAVAELKIKQEYERLEKEKDNAIRAEQAKIEAEKRRAELEAQEAERLAKSRDNQVKIHNEILQDLEKFVDTEKAKELIKAIAKGEIKNLKIIY
jgi:hypothetical protein